MKNSETLEALLAKKDELEEEIKTKEKIIQETKDGIADINNKILEIDLEINKEIRKQNSNNLLGKYLEITEVKGGKTVFVYVQKVAELEFVNFNTAVHGPMFWMDNERLNINWCPNDETTDFWISSNDTIKIISKEEFMDAYYSRVKATNELMETKAN